ncbi:MAG: hypothetical protein WC518_00900 [Patescibacteria group bacterium]
MTNFPIKIGRLAWETDPDVLGDAFIADTDKELKNKLGVIFGIIELSGLPDEVTEKFSEIISDLQTEYYLPPFEIEYGLEKRFEECLQRANRRLYRMIQESIAEIDLGGINSLIGLIHKNKIYLSQIGKNNAFLFHYKKRYEHLIIDIFSQAGEKKSKHNPEKMFSNIISGSITSKDDLLICNNAILEYLSQSNLMEIAAENTSMATISEIEKVLKMQGAKGNFYAVIIQSPGPEEEAATKETSQRLVADRALSGPNAHPQHSINRLLDTQEKTEKYLTPSLLPNWKKALIIIFSALGKATKKLFGYLKIGLAKIGLAVSAVFSGFKQKIVARRPQVKPTPEDFSFADETAPEQALSSAAEPPRIEVAKKRMADESLASNELAETREPKIIRPAAVIKRIADQINLDNYKKIITFQKRPRPLLAISDWLNRQIAKFINLRRPKQILIIALFVLVFLFCQSLVWQGREATANSQVNIDELTKQIEESINSAEAQNIFNDEAGAKNSLSQASELLGKIPLTRKYKKTRDDLGKKVSDLNQLLQKVSYLENPKVVADLKNQNPDSQTVGLAKSGGLLFTFDNQNQKLYKIDLDKSQTIPIQLNNPLTQVAKIVALNNSVLILNGDREFFRHNFSGGTTEKVLTADTAIRDFAVYGDKLYTLKTAKNQIFKHYPSNDVYNSGSPWIKDGTSVKEATALAIDGGVFTAKNNGEINYLAAGKIKESFSIKLDPAFSDIAQIQTEADSNYLYLLNRTNKRIVVVDKKGNLKTQFISKNFSEIKAMSVAEKDKKIYLLADNKIYQIDINF